MTGISSSAILEAYRLGVLTALMVSPGVNAFNCLSVACGEKGILPTEAIRRIYNGQMRPASSGPAQPSIRHFGAGWTPYMFRELPRCLFKPLGAQFLRPTLVEYYKGSPNADRKTNLSFGAIMSLGELPVHSIDTVRVRLQAGKSVIPTLKETGGRSRIAYLYQGALSTVVRQFAIYWAWSATFVPSRAWTRNTLGLDPTTTGFVPCALYQTIPITLSSYSFERVKNHLQTHRLEERGLQRYSTAVRQIVDTQGVRGLMRGFTPKVGSIFCLVLGFNYVAQQSPKK